MHYARTICAGAMQSWQGALQGASRRTDCTPTASQVWTHEFPPVPLAVHEAQPVILCSPVVQDQVTALQVSGLEVIFSWTEISFLPRDLNWCPLGYEPNQDSTSRPPVHPFVKRVYLYYTHTHTPADIIGKVNM